MSSDFCLSKYCLQLSILKNRWLSVQSQRLNNACRRLGVHTAFFRLFSEREAAPISEPHSPPAASNAKPLGANEKAVRNASQDDVEDHAKVVHAVNYYPEH